ncbi:MAG: peptide chain release factor N(5)-glutamine methyltransferase [Candidatus Nitrohelix vancouverensis]|uniref:Release factor glutamine methyltransferase n=1 Tax=Candidatus Nitrohelix vancouverensis TaxID=2705534 RepID=A0A7T0C1J3_9BACT|nr:MAG: peptide chain release factor N(5)-glutamine methyltransferase [Candidatus Nitrohelix vancouverensis]
MPETTIRACIEEVANRIESVSESPRVEAELLLGELLALSREGLITQSARAISLEDAERIEQATARRERGEPLFYILGKREFWSLEFKVSASVLCPRPETEVLIERFLEEARNLWDRQNPLRVLDIGTGSGNIAIVAACEIEGCEVTAVDLSEQALAVARENALRHGVESRIRFVQADLFPEEDEAPFHFILSNPPYIASAEINSLPKDVREFEPRQALDGGADGLDYYRRIAKGIERWLLPGGACLMEIGETQAAAIEEIIRSQSAMQDVRVYKDYADRDRVMVAVRNNDG